MNSTYQSSFRPTWRITRLGRATRLYPMMCESFEEGGRQDQYESDDDRHSRGRRTLRRRRARRVGRTSIQARDISVRPPRPRPLVGSIVAAENERATAAVRPISESEIRSAIPSHEQKRILHGPDSKFRYINFTEEPIPHARH